jgi:hypothetical protein
MADTPTPQPVEPAPVKPRALRSPQDQADANLINTYRTCLTAAQGHPDLVALMQPRGYGVDGLLEGLNACDLAQTTFNARQLALDDKGTAAKAFKAADDAARTGYADFSRIAAKVLADNPTAKAALVIPHQRRSGLQHRAGAHHLSGRAEQTRLHRRSHSGRVSKVEGVDPGQRRQRHRRPCGHPHHRRAQGRGEGPQDVVG